MAFKHRRHRILSTAITTAFLANLVSFVPASADSPGALGSEEPLIAAYVVGADGTPIPLDEVPFESEGAPSEEPSISPYLLDFGQWVSCIQIGNENDSFMHYRFAKDGQVQDVRLKCGNDYYGYRHIKKKHETDWDKLLTAGEATGWIPESQGIESWDDLMAQSAGMVLFGWQNTGYNPGNNKRCAIAKVQWYRMDTYEIVLSKRIIVVFATDSDKLITAYPPKDQSQQTCYPS